MNLGIKNKYALVTGCSLNIGRSIALNLAKEGVNIIAISRNKNRLESLKKELDKYSSNNITLELDLQNKKSLNKINNFILKKKIIIEIIVHNLGGSLGHKDPFSDSNIWKKVWDFNLGISIDINNLIIPFMKKSGWGRIIHISSNATSINIGNSPYIAAKGALESYVKSVSKHLSKFNVIMNCISPGLVNLEGRFYTKLKNNNYKEFKKYIDSNIPIGRMCETNEISSVVTFLCSVHSSYMSGSIVKVDGIGN